MLTRRTLLAGAVAVPGGRLLTACTDDNDRPDTDPEADIFDLTLRTTDRHRPFELISAGFVAVEAGSVTPGPAGRLTLHDGGPPAPFAAVEARLTAGVGAVAVGLASEDGDRVLLRWSAERSRLSLEVRVGGRTRVLRRRKLRLGPDATLAFALCENQVTALVDTGDGWRPVLTERRKVAALVDLREEAVLSRFRYAWGATGVSAEVRAGLFGMTGLRDPHLVQHADGSPYQRDGRQFLTWTCAGLGFFQQAHWSVWSFDPRSPRDMRLEAHLFSRRDGLVLGDHAGHLVRLDDRWLVATSSWGDFAPGNIHVRHTETDADLLSGVHVLDTEPTPLPTEHGTWDPALLLLDGTWHVAFVESPSQDPFDFHPAISRTTESSWTEGLERVGAADDLHQCEGPILVRVGSDTWLLASDKDGQHYPVFDLDGQRRGRLDAPYPTNIPHPQLVPDPAGGWWMVTFDDTQYVDRVMGYGGHGDVVLMHST